MRRVAAQPEQLRLLGERARVPESPETVKRRLAERVSFFAQQADLLEHLENVAHPTIKLIEGMVQCGKTPVICGLAVFFIQVLEIPVVVLVRNFNADKQQLMRKFTDDNRFNDFGIEVVDASDRAIRVQTDLFDRPRLILCIENHTPLKRIVGLYRDQRFALIVDEADAIAYKSRTQTTHEWFQQLREKALHFIAVTATVFDVLYLDHQLTNRDIVRLVPPAEYVGFGSGKLHFMPLSEPFQFNVSPDGSLPSDLEQFYLHEILGSDPYPNAIEEGADQPRAMHPVICLQRIGTQIKDQLNVLNALGKHAVLGQKLVLIAYNGDGVYTYCPHGELPTQIGDAAGTLYDGHRRNKRLRSETASVPVDVQIMCYRTNQISVLLQYYRDNQAQHQVTHIVVIAGKLADRSLNFSSSDYRWHLTHEICLPGKGATVVDIEQWCGRLCRITSDNLHAYLYMTPEDLNDLRRGSRLQDNALTEANAQPETVRMKDFVEQVPVTRDMIPSRRTSRKRQPHWNVVQDDAEENESKQTELRDGQFFRVLPAQLTDHSRSVYNRVVGYLDSRRGVWNRKADVVRAIATNAREGEVFKNLIWQWTNPQHSCFERVATDAESGLLIRQHTDSNWHLRLN